MCTHLNYASYGKTVIPNAGGAYGHMTCQSHSMDDEPKIKTFSSILLNVIKKIVVIGCIYCIQNFCHGVNFNFNKTVMAFKDVESFLNHRCIYHRYNSKFLLESLLDSLVSKMTCSTSTISKKM